MLQKDYGRAGVDASRHSSFLGIECRRGSAVDTDTWQWTRLHVWSHRNSERAQRQ